MLTTVVNAVNWSLFVSILSAVIAVVAAIYAGKQARAAKRQADAAHGEVPPTFHTELHEDNGRPPWGFRLEVRNFNRRPLRVKRVRIQIPAGLIVYDDSESNMLSRQRLDDCARGEVPFEINKILDGVSPNAGMPTSYTHDFYAGFRTGTSEERRTVRINTTVEWEYASGKISSQTEKISLGLPMGKARE